MSGGHFDYKDYNLQYIADDIEHIIESNNDNRPDDWGGTVGRHYEEATLERLRDAVRYLKIAQIYTHRTDYLLSGDDGEDYFHKRLEREIEGLKL